MWQIYGLIQKSWISHFILQIVVKYKTEVINLSSHKYEQSISYDSESSS
jgi:hypothetical protein